MTKYNELILEVEKRYGYNLLKNKSRMVEVTNLRAAVVNIMMRVWGAKLVEVGRFLGMDHTSALHHKRLHDAKYLNHDNYPDIYDALYEWAMFEYRHTNIIDTLGLLDLVKTAFHDNVQEGEEVLHKSEL